MQREIASLAARNSIFCIYCTALVKEMNSRRRRCYRWGDDDLDFVPFGGWYGFSIIHLADPRVREQFCTSAIASQSALTPRHLTRMLANRTGVIPASLRTKFKKPLGRRLEHVAAITL